MPIAWHPKRWLNFACEKMRKKNRTNRFLLSNTFNVYNLRVLGYFST